VSKIGKCILYSALFALLSVAAFGTDPTLAKSPSPQMLEGLSPEAVMNLANTWGMNYDENKVMVWTTSRAFHFDFPDGTKTEIAMPSDRMVVSIAPYILKNHPCKDHTPSTCRGELPNTPVSVVAVTADGQVILKERTNTSPNGFVDLWLPRNLKIDITLEARGLVVTQRISTFDTDKTCITEAKLHY
jgi:hypothetical protein